MTSIGGFVHANTTKDADKAPLPTLGSSFRDLRTNGS